MNPLQPQYFSPRTFLELEGDKKIVIIDHPKYGQHRFPLPTKEEISKEYSYHSEPSKKKPLNSFMIFRTYLQKSKQNQNYFILGEVSKIASDAWSYATKDVLEACNELEEKLKESFKNKIFVSYSPYPHQRPKRLKKIKPPSSKKKESSSPNTFSSSEEQVYLYPSPTPSMINTPLIPSMITPPSMNATPISFPDPIYSYSPLSPMCIIEPQQTNMPLLALGPTLSSEEILTANSDQNQYSSLFPLTPSQIFGGLDQNFLGSGLTHSLTSSLGEKVTLDAVPTLNEPEAALMEMQQLTWNFESSSILPEDEQNWY